MDFALIAVAAFAAGVLNTIAGGGTFLTLPALVAIGVPVVAANATSAVAVFPGYLGGALGYRAELRDFAPALLLRLTLVALSGGLAGALLLMASSDAAFSAVVPFLLLLATLAFLFGDEFRAWAARSARSVRPYGAFGLFCVSLYGGYFNGGLGIVLLALFSLWGLGNIHAMNALKNGISFALSAISVAAFATAGLVAWPEATVMMAASVVGGYAGAPLARRVPRGALRALIAAIGFGMSAVFFHRWLG